MPKPRKLDAATEQQAIARAQRFIEVRRGLSPEHSRDYWRFSAKAELRGQVEAGERFVQGIKDAFKEHGEVSVRFLPGSRTWNEKLAAKLVAEAKQGDGDADQVLREVAAEFLTKRIRLPDELVDYVAAYLQQANSSKKQSHKTEYRDWILALTVDEVARHFSLNHTRNRATEGHCACSIVARATRLSEPTIQNVWHDYKGVADRRTPTNYVGQARVSVTSKGAQKHYLLSFPRVGSPEAMSRPSNRKTQRAKAAGTDSR